MDKETLLKTIKDIGTCDDDSTRRTLLADFEKELSADYDRLSNLETSNQSLSADIEKLQKDNMKLFLSIGEKNKEDTAPTPTEPEQPKLTYDKLFNEKGELM